MTYPSMSASGGMVQESRIPLEPTGVPSRSKGGPGTGRKKREVCEREKRRTVSFLIVYYVQYHQYSGNPTPIF